MRRTSLLALVVSACAPAQSGSWGPPDGTLETVASGIAVAQAPTFAAQAPRRDALDACDEPGIDVHADAPPHYLALPTLWIDGTEDLARSTQVVRVGGGACDVVAAFPADLQPRGTGSTTSTDLDGTTVRYSVGLLLDLVDVGDELWLFTNTTDGFWHVDPVTGAIVHDDGVEGRPVGATADGAGGAWVTTAPVYDAEVMITPGRLWHLDATGAPSEPTALPFDVYVSSLVHGDDAGHRIPMFVFQPVAVTLPGDVWLLHSENGDLYRPDTDETVHTGLVQATGLVAWGDNVLVSAGSDVDRTQTDANGEPVSTLIQAPALYHVNLSDGTVSDVAVIPEGDLGWADSGSWWGPSSVSAGIVPYDVWFPVARFDDTVLVADPIWGRVFALEPVP